jgi:probable rRNA maturation factor
MNQRRLLVVSSIFLLLSSPPTTMAWATTAAIVRLSSSLATWRLLHGRMVVRPPCSRSDTATPSLLSSSSRSGRCVRLFGSKAVPGNPPGAIFLDWGTHKNKYDEARLLNTIQHIRRSMGYETYDIAVLLVSSRTMRETNLETRGVNTATDILSFPFLEAVRPGVLEAPAFGGAIPDYFNLGDVMVCPQYVAARCAEDEAYYSNNTIQEDSDVSDNEGEDRGVSSAMARVFSVEDRINMLMVHGMLHLTGYDHEEDEEYEEMVTREEEILKELGFTASKE